MCSMPRAALEEGVRMVAYNHRFHPVRDYLTALHWDGHKRLATWLRRSGGIPAVSGDDPVGHMLFLQHDQPEVVARARWLLEPVDYLTMRFTGVPAASHASMTGAWLTDNRSLATLAYDDVLVRATGVDASRLPPLVATGSVVGTLSPSVAADLGLPPTAVAVTGLPDLHSAAVGAGAIGLGEPHASIGTTAWISAPVPRKKSDLLRMTHVHGPGHCGFTGAERIATFEIMIERTLLIKTRLGLHARAAAKLVRVASGFRSRVQLQRLDGQGAAGQCADAKSILSVLALAASVGTVLRIRAEGDDESDAFDAITKLFADGFGEV